MNSKLITKRRRVPVLFLLPLLFLILPPRTCLADMVGYADRATVTGQSSRFTAVHFHDWSDRTHKERAAVFALNHHEEIFSPKKNRFSSLKLFDRASGKMVFQAPVPALTYLWVSPDAKFVVGLSKVMLQNPYQVVVFTTDGKLLYKEHIASSLAVLTQTQLGEFYSTFPQAKAFLSPRTRTVGNKAYIDAFISGMPNVIGDRAFMRLLDFSQRNPYSPNFSESVTNWVFWFNERYPQVEIREENGATRLWLNDPKGSRFSLLVRDSSPE